MSRAWSPSLGVTVILVFEEDTSMSLARGFAECPTGPRTRLRALILTALDF